MSKAYLILADGTVFEGKSIGAEGKTIGETVFTTGMTGYIETLTDPSYFGQIVTQTFPLIGNYGVIAEDAESKKSWVRGYIVRELCDKPSNFRCEDTLDSFLKKQNIIGIAGIDTRKLTKILREAGVMNGMILSGEESEKLKTENGKLKVENSLLEEIRSYKIENAVKSVQQKVESSLGEVSPSLQTASRSSATPSAGRNNSERLVPRNAPFFQLSSSTILQADWNLSSMSMTCGSQWIFMPFFSMQRNQVSCLFANCPIAIWRSSFISSFDLYFPWR